LHDLQSGKVKNAITSGDGNVTQLLRVDEAARTVLLSRASARKRDAIRTSVTSIAKRWTASPRSC
jgi:hypothetical protein